MYKFALLLQMHAPKALSQHEYLLPHLKDELHKNVEKRAEKHARSLRLLWPSLKPFAMLIDGKFFRLKIEKP
jgi:hypothetical protein